MKKLILLCSAAAICPTTAFAQSTGSQDFEEEAIVITGTRTQEVGGIQAPDTPKPKAVLDQEFIARQNPGQTILDTINAVPGVSFTNNDAYGSSGGTLTIRGFDSSRISLTFDGLPLNDSGNYAIYSNQQLDPELIEQVNVNLGTTDVDSPTASAVGGTVNYRTRLPHKELGGRVAVSLGEYDFRRIFASFDTGEIGPWNTRAFFTASTAKNDNPFNNYGKVDKQQYNARIYQPIGSNGDFISVSGNYNQNRNNFFGSVRLIDGPATPNGFPSSRDDRKYDILYPCTTDVAQPGVRDLSNNCGTEFDRRYNPSNTGNIRAQSKFTLTDKLTLTVDPSFQYVKANGGGTIRAEEGTFNIAGVPYTGSFITSPTGSTATPYFGRDLNGDGDTLDQVIMLNPSQTQTRRYGVIAGLRYRFNDDHTVRASFTYDHAYHRQTGQHQLLQFTGEPFDVFPVNDPEQTGTSLSPSTTDGVDVNKRDRKSQAILAQVAGEYIGSFFDDRLTLNLGLRAPFFTRKLDQRCFTVNTNANGVTCFSGDTDAETAYRNAFPYVVDPVTGNRVSGYSPPQKRELKYDKLLPNLGFTFDITRQLSVFGSYAKGLSVPGTDQLYSAFFFPEGTEEAKPDPETTDTYDAGLRFRSSKIQAQLGIWTTKFKNRIAESYDPELDLRIYRNLGEVDKWGIDGSVAYAPIPELTLYAFGSWNKSKIKDNLVVGGAGGFDCDAAPLGTPAQVATALRNCAFTAGKREAGTPTYTFGGSAVGKIGDLDIGITAKRTGPRYIYDTNTPIFAGDLDCVGVATPANGTQCPVGNSAPVQVFDAKAPAYWLVNLDIRYNLRKLVGLEKSYIQLNVYNLFDELYVGGFGGNLNQSVNTDTRTTSAGVNGGTYGTAPFVQIGAPRTISGTLSIEF